MARPAQAVIDLAAIRHNYRLAKSLAPGCRALAVVKGNAYGHGAIAVAKALENEADALGVACIEEALELREAGVASPILLLEGFFNPSELPLIAKHQLDIVLHSQQQIQHFLTTDLKQRIKIWLKMDSGMHRLGLKPEQYLTAYRALKASPQVEAIVLMSHLSRADELDSDFTQTQRCQFLMQAQALGEPISLANSSAILAWPDCHHQWIRPGMMLYGASPLDRPTLDSAKLRPAMELQSELIAIRDLTPGDCIGYGTHYQCDAPTRVGVVAMGYADGFPRHAPNGLPVLINDARSELIGRVSMDMLTVDLTHLPSARVGDPVLFWGRQLPVELIADHCGTIPYELVCQLTPRVARVYRD